jgi:uncharacterized membrane protein
LKFTVRLPHDLLVLVALSIAAVVTASVWQVPPLRLILGLLYLMFFPGYALVAALFPGRDDLPAVQRLTLSLILSLAAVSLVTLILNWTPWGVRLEPTLVSVTLLIGAACSVASYRRSRLPAQDRFVPQLDVSLPSWSVTPAPEKVAMTALTLSMILAIGTVLLLLARPKVTEHYTEFYVLGPGGSLEGYPLEAVANEPITLVLGIVNGEHDHVSYRVERDVSSRERVEMVRIQLADGERWEKPLTFFMGLPEADGEACYLEKLSFFLFKDDQIEPYRTVYLEVALLPDTAPIVSPRLTAQPSPTAAPGQLPSPSPTSTPTTGPAPQPTRSLAVGVVHIVRSGETLSAISSQYGVSLEALILANDLRDVDLLEVGQEIIIPPSSDA